MRQLETVEMRPIKLYESIAINCDSEKREVLIEEKLNVYIRYRAYIKNKMELVNMATLDYSDREQVKEYFLSCYGENVNLNKLKKEIKEQQDAYYQAYCPYCEINEPGTFDHYLPKGKFPEFSVLSLNLIPCCATCNSKKGERWKENNGRLFINYYYDEIPNEQYLYADLLYKAGSDIPLVSFNIINNSGIDEIIFQRINNHFIKLNLLNRYVSKANSKISSVRKSCRMRLQKEITIDDIKELLHEDLEVQKSDTGVNNWEYALLQAIINSDEFWEHI